uniref:Secreted protein n=1 Tax=Laticauda laticaudata TaxID=8630 RepID=A0A8C5RC81_LATLA
MQLLLLAHWFRGSACSLTDCIPTRQVLPVLLIVTASVRRLLFFAYSCRLSRCVPFSCKLADDFKESCKSAGTQHEPNPLCRPFWPIQHFETFVLKPFITEISSF